MDISSNVRSRRGDTTFVPDATPSETCRYRRFHAARWFGEWEFCAGCGNFRILQRGFPALSAVKRPARSLRVQAPIAAEPLTLRSARVHDKW